MEEIKTFAFFLAFYHLFRKKVVFFHDLRQVFLPKCVLLRWICHYRLYRNLLESKVCKMKNILGEIKIMMSEGSSYIILVLVTGLCKFLKLRKNQIIASCPFAEWAHKIVNFLTAINTEDHISHLFVAEFHYLIVQQNTVGSKGKTEFFIVDFLLLTAVCYQVLNNLPVHKRLAAKEIHLQIVSGA